MATEEEHFNVSVKVSRVGKTAYSPGKPSERTVEDLVYMSVKADTMEASIAKAIRLLQTESGEQA